MSGRLWSAGLRFQMRLMTWNLRPLRCSIIRGGMEQYLTPMGPTKLHVNPIFEIGPLEPRFEQWLVRAPPARPPGSNRQGHCCARRAVRALCLSAAAWSCPCPPGAALAPPALAGLQCVLGSEPVAGV
jgi:hypothetical protein